MAIGLIYGQTAGFGFVFDNGPGVCQNPLVTQRLSLRGALAVFTERHVESSSPLSCLSHVLVWHLFGHGAAVHHLTNLVLYAASAVLLFLVLRAMTGRLWPSALATAIFAVHPLRVESVAWVTERKDVLSGLFFLLALAAYLGYVRRPFSLPRYLAVLVCFTVSLAAKPIAVTMPFLLLLLDYWPLGRTSGGNSRPPIPPDVPAEPSRARQLIVEKIPLLAIAGLFCLVAIRGQGAALDVSHKYSLGWRIGNALVSYAFYLGKLVWPVNLAALYPRTEHLPHWRVVGASFLVAGITGATVAWRRRFPYLLVGWLWYLGALVPVIGLVQFGAQSEADRFTYLPQIGLTVALVWAAAGACRTLTRWRRFQPSRGTVPIFVSAKMGLSPSTAQLFR